MERNRGLTQLVKQMNTIMIEAERYDKVVKVTLELPFIVDYNEYDLIKRTTNGFDWKVNINIKLDAKHRKQATTITMTKKK